MRIEGERIGNMLDLGHMQSKRHEIKADIVIKYARFWAYARKRAKGDGSKPSTALMLSIAPKEAVLSFALFVLIVPLLRLSH